MASKTTTTLTLFFALNLIFFSLTTACNTCKPPKPNPKPVKPKPKPKPKPPPSSGYGKCPRDALKLGVCADLLGGLIDLSVGKPPVSPCCTLIEGLADLEAAVCLCTAIKARVLGLKLNLPVSLSLLLNVCKKKVPRDFQC